MSASPAPRSEPARQILRRLVLLRYVVIGAEAAALVAIGALAEVEIRLGAAFACLAGLALANLATQWRLRQALPVTDHELTSQLLLDVVALTGLLHFSGSVANPLVSLYLLPIIVAAAVLPARHAWAMAAATAGAYSLLVAMGLPGHAAHGADVNLHLLGMWLTFGLSALLIPLFVLRMAQSIRERDRLLAAAREDALRSERIVALGTLAAGAAHELGTPLATIAMVASELEGRCGSDPQAREDLDELKLQISECKRIISALVASAEEAAARNAARRPADAFIQETIAKWRMMRPAAECSFRWREGAVPPSIPGEPTLSQALINLLNNAADASPESVEVEARSIGPEVLIEIRDRGPGLSPEAISRAGEAFFTTKAPGKGLGLGLFLANATVERLGGRVRLFNREGGGACTQVVLPAAAAENAS